jgi:hypothetical protein
MHTDRQELIGYDAKASAAADLSRYAAQFLGWCGILKIIC